MRRAPKPVLISVFFAALLLDAVVLYFMDDQTMRLFVGLAVFLIIAWLFANTDVAGAIGDIPENFRRRRYPRLRTQVTMLLAEVRRLHWTAVDLARGVRNSEEAVAEMDAIEERLRDLLIAVRREAGVTSDEPDTGSSPDEPSEAAE